MISDLLQFQQDQTENQSGRLSMQSEHEIFSFGSDLSATLLE